jgi:hypothetical protein
MESTRKTTPNYNYILNQTKISININPTVPNKLT